MAKRYYQRASYDKPPLPGVPSTVWEVIGNRVGVLEIEESEPVALALKSWVDRRVGGVNELTKEQYEDLKKKPPQPSRNHTWSERQGESRIGTDLKGLRAAAGVDNQPEQEESPEPSKPPVEATPKVATKPVTRKMKKVKMATPEEP